MMPVLVLTGRNLRLFFRDRSGVFFSLLSALILVGLYVLFLGRLQVDNLSEQIPAASQGDIQWFVNTWVFAGITMMTTLTTALAALSTFVDDRSTGRFSDFLISPIRRRHLIFGYLTASFLISLMMSTVVLLAGEVYLYFQGNVLMTFSQCAEALGYIALSSAAFAALSSCAVTFLKSSGAFAALSTVAGTVIGFLAGAYIPVGTLPLGVVNALNALPFAHSAMLIRGPFTAESLQAVTGGQPQAVADIQEFYGMTGSVGSVHITTTLSLTVLMAVLIIFSALGAVQISRRIR